MPNKLYDDYFLQNTIHGTICGRVRIRNSMTYYEYSQLLDKYKMDNTILDLRFEYITKEEIFELYVNRIFLGNRSYGIEAAANTYFDKKLEDLTLSESATIAALVQLPSRVNPVKDPRRTIQRRDWILSRMLILDYIDLGQYEEAINQDVVSLKPQCCIPPADFLGLNLYIKIFVLFNTLEDIIFKGAIISTNIQPISISWRANRTT